MAAAFCILTPIAAASKQPERAALKPDEFVTSWVVLAPIKISEPSDEPSLKRAWAQDWLSAAGGERKVRPRAGSSHKVAQQTLSWRTVQASEGVINFEPLLPHAIAYAWSEVDVPAATKGLLGIGSDDAIKVWLNGKLVHENWALRPTTPDDDVVPVEFQRGKNTLLVKVLNAEGGWGFALRPMGPKGQGEKLAQAATAYDIEALKRDLDLGMDVNATGELGLTALQSARLAGNVEAVRFLTSRGANVSAPLPPSEQVVERLFASSVRKDGSGLAVLIARDGKILFEKGYGLSDVEHHVPVTPQTQFRIGSITKQFTAAAILKLQEQGKLSVKDKLSKYIPDFPRGNEVTLRHLLTHTSGIHNFTADPNFNSKVGLPVTTEELIRIIKGERFDFDPGAKWDYSNSGFALLGYIVEKVSGQSLGDYLQTTFFRPLGMASTGIYRSDLKLPHEALGYQFLNARFTSAPRWEMSWAAGAGALYSTVEDLFRWNEAVFNGKVLSKASLEAAFTSARTTDGLETGYGYGWAVSTLRGSQLIAHGGGLPGFSSYLLRIPAQRSTVVVLGNAAPGLPGTMPERLAYATVSFYLGEQLPVRETSSVPVSTNALDALVGRYDHSGPVMTVTREGDRLFAQLAFQRRLELFPRSETEFFTKVVDAQLTFVKDKSGKAVKIIHRQDGRQMSAFRIEDVQEVNVDPAQLDAVLGKYDYGHSEILTVTREGSHLFAQLTGQPRTEIHPRSSTEFFWKEVVAQVTFVKNDQGKVTKAIHHQDGQTIEAPKIQ